MNTVAFTRFHFITVLAVIAMVSPGPADATLLLYYDFNDAAASATDKSGFGNSGTINGPVYSDPGMGYNNTPGRSMDFNGGTNIIQVDNGSTAFDSVLTTGSISIAFWIFGDVWLQHRAYTSTAGYSDLHVLASIRRLEYGDRHDPSI